MLDPDHPIAQLIQEDRRYTFEAYVFIFEALHYAQNVLAMGAEHVVEPAEEGQEQRERHVTGQELCEAIRRYALEQYGYMAKTVLEPLGHPRHGRLRRDRFQPDPHRPDAKDAGGHPRRFRQHLRLRDGLPAGFQDRPAMMPTKGLSQFSCQRKWDCPS